MKTEIHKKQKSKYFIHSFKYGISLILLLFIFGFAKTADAPERIEQRPEKKAETTKSSSFFRTDRMINFFNDISEKYFSTKGSTVMGSTEGKFSVDLAGNSTYSIPITISPGSGGMQPSLSLNYNSGGDNDFIGQGWSLGGIYTINRGGANKTNSSSIDPMDFDNNDKFYLNGQLLVCIKGTYGEDGAEYRTENETFSKIISYGKVGNGPVKFKVWTRNGLIYEYAYTADSRIEAQGKTDVISWAVNKISDTKGNYMNFIYDEYNNAGYYYIKEIDYTGNINTGLLPYNKVIFTYETRPDPITHYYSNCLKQINKRLVNIKTLNDGNLLRRYDLSYQNINHNISQLTSVQETGSDGTSFKPTIFTWNKISGGTYSDRITNTPVASGNYSTCAPIAGDVNGDGLTDMIWIWTPYDHGTRVYVSLATGNGHYGSIISSVPVSSGNYGTCKPTVGDVNGDGLTDIIWTWNTYNKGVRVYTSLSKGNGHFGAVIASTPTSSGNYGTCELTTGDANGDGLTDVIWTWRGWNNSGLRVYTSLSQGNGHFGSVIGSTVASTKNYRAANWHRAISGDVNGDGLTDLIWIYRGIHGIQTQVSLAVGNGHYKTIIGTTPSVSSSYVASNWHSAVTGDANGDGLIDLIWTYNGLHGLKTLVSLSRGNGHFVVTKETTVTTSGNYGVSNWHSAVTGDANGDGLTDLFWTYNGLGGLRVRVSLATKNGLYSGLQSSVPNSGADYTHKNWRSVIPVDADGDGLTDLIWTYNGISGTRVHTSLNTGIKGYNKISKIIDGFNDEININYKPLTDKSIYTKGTGSVYPNVDIQIPVQVVSSYNSSDGIGGKNTVSYKYYGLVLNQSGRGGGFKKIETKNETTGIRTVAYLSDNYHYRGMIYKSEKYLSNGTLISKTENTFDRKTFDTGINERWFPFTSKKIQYKYETDGSLINTITNIYQFSDWGNATYTKLEYPDGHKTETKNTYTDNINKWLLGRLTHSEVTKSASGTPVITKITDFEYDPESGMLVKETSNPGDGWHQLVKNYTQDAYGNIIQSKVAGFSWGVRTHTLTTTYDNKGRFITKTKNTLGYIKTSVHDPLTGKTLSETGPNGLTTTFAYDGFGRRKKQTFADGNSVATIYQFCSGGDAPAHAVYCIKEQISGAPETVTYFDGLGRKLRTQKVGFDGTEIFTDIQYNNKGETVKTSKPYYKGDSPVWFTNKFDDLQRVIKETNPVTGSRTIVYNGLIITNINELGQTKTKEYDKAGNLIKITDNIGNSITYKYDAAGRLIETKDMNGVYIRIGYDINGNKAQIQDPDAGRSYQTFDAFGNKVYNKNGKGEVCSYSYDNLGRIIQKKEPEQTVTYTYDTGNKAIGKLSSVSSTTGYYKQFNYDKYGRLISTSTKMPGDDQTFAVSQTYDSYGRVKDVIYPSGFKVTNKYNNYNYLSQIKRTSDGFVYFTANKINSLGETEVFTLGNGLKTIRTYDDVGRLTGINTGNGNIQNLKYTYNDINNLTSRKDIRRGLTETLTFDVLDRLQNSTVKNNSGATLESLQMNYDANGNIIYKSDVGCYSYEKTGNAGPHALTAIDGKGTYSYDKDGNIIKSPDYTATYNSYNKPLSIIKNSNKLEFDYGPEHQKCSETVYKNGSFLKQTFYVGGLYEKVKTVSGVIEKNYIKAGNYTIAVYTHSNSPSQSSETVYLHKDHLGSVVEITDKTGKIKESFSYDAWGKRRNPGNWTAVGSWDNLPFYNMGFTLHEHLDEVGLINMKGRIYDPETGRFLNADIVIQDMTDTQNFNRYSYVLNDPLSNTDPTGFFGFHPFRFIRHVVHAVVSAVTSVVRSVGHAISRVLHNVVKETARVVKQIVKVAAPVIIIVAAACYGYVGAFIASAITSKINGASWSNSFKAGVITVAEIWATAGIGHDLGSISENWLTRSIAHGILDGVVSEVQGGKFEHGFLTGLVGSAAGNEIQKFDYWKAVGANAIVGGTTSKLSGGKFANGAMTGAFIMMFNDKKQETMNNLKEYPYVPNWAKSTGKMVSDTAHAYIRDDYNIVEGTKFAGNFIPVLKPVADGLGVVGKVAHGVIAHESMSETARYIGKTVAESVGTKVGMALCSESVVGMPVCGYIGGKVAGVTYDFVLDHHDFELFKDPSGGFYGD